MSMTNVLVLEPSRPSTAAERGLQEAFARQASELPGQGWVTRVRADAMRSFVARGLPTRRIEEFKYTDLRERLKETYSPAPSASAVTKAQIDTALGPLAALDAFRLVFVNGAFRADLSASVGLAATAELMPLAPLLAKAPAWLEDKFAPGRLGEETALTSLNTAFMSDGLMLKIKPGQNPGMPVLLVSARSGGEPSAIALRHVIDMEPGAQLTLVEAHVALAGAAPKGLSNTLTDITVADGASLDHIKCALDGAAATHVSNWVAKVGAKVRVMQAYAGGVSETAPMSSLFSFWGSEPAKPAAPPKAVRPVVKKATPAVAKTTPPPPPPPEVKAAPSAEVSKAAQ